MRFYFRNCPIALSDGVMEEGNRNYASRLTDDNVLKSGVTVTLQETSKNGCHAGKFMPSIQQERNPPGAGRSAAEMAQAETLTLGTRVSPLGNRHGYQIHVL